MLTEIYIHEHFKWTWTKNGWIFVEVSKRKTKPVTGYMWRRLKKYGEPKGWVFRNESGVKFFTCPFTEAEKKQLAETGDPAVSFIKV